MFSHGAFCESFVTVAADVEVHFCLLERKEAIIFKLITILLLVIIKQRSFASTASLQKSKKHVRYSKKIQISFYKIQSIVLRRTKIKFQGLFTIRLDNVECRRI